MNTTPKPGFVTAHTERHAREDRELASHWGAGQAPPAPPAPPPAPRKSPEAVRTVVTITRSGAKMETRVGLEPRDDVEAPQARSDNFRGSRARAQLANARHNRRCRHLGGA